MSNSLTGISDYNLFLGEEAILENKKSKIINNKNSKSDKSFSRLLNEKLDKNGKVDVNKLDAKDKKLYSACVDFESLLWKQVLNSMKATVGKYKLLDGGQTEEIFTDFLYDEYSNMMAKRSQTDIATTIFKELSRGI
jgi:Rod binding domain-containing protein